MTYTSADLRGIKFVIPACPESFLFHKAGFPARGNDKSKYNIIAKAASQEIFIIKSL
jgi:hypothetical protein